MAYRLKPIRFSSHSYPPKYYWSSPKYYRPPIAYCYHEVLLQFLLELLEADLGDVHAGLGGRDALDADADRVALAVLAEELSALYGFAHHRGVRVGVLAEFVVEFRHEEVVLRAVVLDALEVRREGEHVPERHLERVAELPDLLAEQLSHLDLLPHDTLERVVLPFDPVGHLERLADLDQLLERAELRRHLLVVATAQGNPLDGLAHPPRTLLVPLDLVL